MAHPETQTIENLPVTAQLLLADLSRLSDANFGLDLEHVLECISE